LLVVLPYWVPHLLKLARGIAAIITAIGGGVRLKGEGQ